MVLFIPCAFAQEEVIIEPSKDNTLFENDEGSISNGAGQYLFIGTTNSGEIRRTVLAFDLEGAVPDGAQILDASLELNMSKTMASTRPASVHRLTADWGEGTSDAAAEEGAGSAATADDATWIHRFHDTATWTTPGGDFEATASATFDVSGLGTYAVSTQGLVDDVQMWLNDPSSNFGWILIGDEGAPTTAKRFDSRENASAGNRPMLTITYADITAAERSDVPSTLRLMGSYPNPFTQSTTVHYALERAHHVAITLYDVLGREVRSLVREHQAAGSHQVAVKAAGLPAGTYFYCFEGGICGKMAILR